MPLGVLSPYLQFGLHIRIILFLLLFIIEADYIFAFPNDPNAEAEAIEKNDSAYPGQY